MRSGRFRETLKAGFRRHALPQETARCATQLALSSRSRRSLRHLPLQRLRKPELSQTYSPISTSSSATGARWVSLSLPGLTHRSLRTTILPLHILALRTPGYRTAVDSSESCPLRLRERDDILTRQVHVLHRHGARYPTGSEEDAVNDALFAAKIGSIQSSEGSEAFSGPLSVSSTSTSQRSSAHVCAR